MDFVAPEKPKLDDNVPLGALGGERRGSTVLKMRGLPYSTEKEEIIEFFASVPNIAPVDADNIHIALNEMGRPAGTAFVEFPTPDDLTAALQTKNKDEIGGRYIELFPSSREEATRSAQRAALGGF